MKFYFSLIAFLVCSFGCLAQTEQQPTTATAGYTTTCDTSEVVVLFVTNTNTGYAQTTRCFKEVKTETKKPEFDTSGTMLRIYPAPIEVRYWILTEKGQILLDPARVLTEYKINFE